MDAVFVFGAKGTLGKEVINILSESYYVIEVERSPNNILEYKYEKTKGIVKINLANLEHSKHFSEVFEKLKKFQKFQSINIVYLAAIYKEENIEEIFNINCLSFYYIIKNYIQVFMNLFKGNIVTIGSNLLERVNMSSTAYISSKSALVFMTKQFAYEYGNYGFRFNSVSPGFFCSKMNKDTTTEKDLSILIKNTPLKRLGTPKDVSKIIRFLLSEESYWITGENIIVDGGNSLGF